LCFWGRIIKDKSYVIYYIPCTPQIESLIAERERFCEKR
jgi:hypothetical protein